MDTEHTIEIPADDFGAVCAEVAAFLNDEDEAQSAFDVEAAEASALEAFEDAREAAYWDRLISDAEEARR